jgi:hypothetical protein
VIRTWGAVYLFQLHMADHIFYHKIRGSSLEASLHILCVCQSFDSLSATQLFWRITSYVRLLENIRLFPHNTTLYLGLSISSLFSVLSYAYNYQHNFEF